MSVRTHVNSAAHGAEGTCMLTFFSVSEMLNITFSQCTISNLQPSLKVIHFSLPQQWTLMLIYSSLHMLAWCTLLCMTEHSIHFSRFYLLCRRQTSFSLSSGWFWNEWLR